MQRSSSRLQRTLLAFTFTILTLGASAFGQTESLLYTFTGGADGSEPFGNLIFDSAGNLYGTTDAGGVNDGNGGKGVVFELSPATGGGWTETVLYAFTGGSDGQNPFGGVVFDTAGNLYGTTNFGGAHNLGTVFELSPTGGGGWTESVIYSFAGGTGGGNPNGGLTIDSAGNLYGSTEVGGFGNKGTVFQVSPVSSGGWTESTILNASVVGGNLFGAVTFDSAGNLYVLAARGGASNAGTIIRLTFVAGVWRSRVIYTFTGGTDGNSPIGALTFQYPRFYGTTQTGGSHGFGTVFALIPASGGSWTEHVIHSFGAPNNGLYPTYPLLVNAGNIFSTTGSGGASGDGLAFELSLISGVWTETVLHNFATGVSDAGGPAGGFVIDDLGNLYGLGHNGGAFGAGGVYKITP